MVVTFMSLPANPESDKVAYQRPRGAGDALAYMVLMWLGSFQR